MQSNNISLTEKMQCAKIAKYDHRLYRYQKTNCATAIVEVIGNMGLGAFKLKRHHAVINSKNKSFVDFFFLDNSNAY